MPKEKTHRERPIHGYKKDKEIADLRWRCAVCKEIAPATMRLQMTQCRRCGLLVCPGCYHHGWVDASDDYLCEECWGDIAMD